MITILLSLVLSKWFIYVLAVLVLCLCLIVLLVFSGWIIANTLIVWGFSHLSPNTAQLLVIALAVLTASTTVGWCMYALEEQREKRRVKKQGRYIIHFPEDKRSAPNIT